MEILVKELYNIIDTLVISEELKTRLLNVSENGLVYPFNKIENMFVQLIDSNIISIDKYRELKESYLSRNKNLYLYEISAPRTFGDVWTRQYLKSIMPEIQEPSKELDINYNNQYDMWLDNIRLEIKSSRAVDFDRPRDKLYSKALKTDSDKRFDMNFQQIKPNCADVFIWIGVWLDDFRHWVLNSNELRHNRHFSVGQHRGSIGEGQLHLNEKNLQEGLRV